MVIRRNLQPQPGPSGTVVFWLVALVIGLGVGLVVVYHFMLSSHNGQVTGLAKVKRPTTTLQASIDASDDMKAAQEALLNGQPTAATPATGPVATTAAPPSATRSGPQPSPGQ